MVIVNSVREEFDLSLLKERNGIGNDFHCIEERSEEKTNPKTSNNI